MSSKVVTLNANNNNSKHFQTELIFKNSIEYRSLNSQIGTILILQLKISIHVIFY